MKTRKEFLSSIQKAKLIVIKIGSARVSGEETKINDFLYDLVGDIRTSGPRKGSDSRFLWSHCPR